MEVLGATASIIGLIQLASRVASLSYEYIGSAKRASKDIKELFNEVNSLKEILVELEKYTEEARLNQTALSLIKKPLSECAHELEKLEKVLESSVIKKKKKKGWSLSRIMGSLKWPFKEVETLEIIARIGRYKGVLDTALSMDHMKLSKEIKNDVQDLRGELLDKSAALIALNTEYMETSKGIKKDIQDIQSERQKEAIAQKKEKRKIVLDWVYHERFDTKHNGISSRRLGNTGEWLLRSREFQEFINGKPDNILWGYGIPGAGKTFLSSFAIDYFQEHEEKSYAVAYIYFDYQERQNQSPIQILSSLVKQLAVQMAHLPPGLEELYDRLEDRGKRPTIKQLYPVLLSMFQHFANEGVFLVLDALDECEQETQRRELLPLFHKMAKDGASLFLTSRQHPEDIRESLCSVPKIEISAHDEDIRSYVELRIDENPRARRLVELGKCKERIISEMIDCANGMFLLVRFNIDYICQQTTANQVQKALETLKDSEYVKYPLNTTYDRVMGFVRSQPESCANLAIQVFSWILNAKRALTVEEIRVAVSIQSDRYELDYLDLPDRATLLDVCAGLVTIDENSEIIRLAHFTVQEYFQRNPVTSSPDDKLPYAIACITYLSFDIFNTDCGSDYEIKHITLKLNPFLGYAATQMLAHLRECDEGRSKEYVLKFFEHPRNLSTWIQTDACLRKYPGDCPQGCIYDSLEAGEVLLQTAAFTGHFRMTQQLLDEGADISSYADWTGDTALMCAALQGHDAVVKFLLDKGTHAPERNPISRTALHQAASEGHEEATQLLLDNGANTTTQDKWHQTALHLAATEDHGRVIQLLLDNGANISEEDASGKTALHLAVKQGNEKAIRLLLDNGANISKADKKGWSPLGTALAINPDEAIVRLLLGRGAEDSLAQIFSEISGKGAIMKLLLERGFDLKSPNPRDGQTKFPEAVRQGYEGVVGLLLDNGADILERNNKADEDMG